MTDGIDTAQTAEQHDDELVPGMTAVSEESRVARPPGGRVDQFDVVLRGYDRHQVDDYLAQLGGYVAQLRADLGATTEELTRVRTELERGRPGFDALGERVSQMLGLAEAEADQMRTQARTESADARAAADRDAAQTRSDAQRDAEELAASTRRELADLGRRRTELLQDLDQIRSAIGDVLDVPTRRIDLSEPARVPTAAPSEPS